MSARGRPANTGWLQEGIIRGHMLGKTMLPGDEELGKKDDDHRSAPARRTARSTWLHTFRWRRKRTLLAVIGTCLVYVLWGRAEGLGGASLQYTPGFAPSYGYDEPVEPTGAPPGVTIPTHGSKHVFDGAIRFYRLRASIRQSASHTQGYDESNRNVLFAAASLKSVSNLLPMACEMSKWSRNYVHFAFMGRDDIPLADILEINGIDEKKCPAIWHDARPDYLEYSSDTRAEMAVSGAMAHIHTYLHPQAAIMDDAGIEDAFFVRDMRSKTRGLGMSLIEIPKGAVDTLMWLTRLDAGSLRNWHSPSVDILVQVPPESSSVLRLLKSIRNADYSGLRPPRIILELPAELDQSVKTHIENFVWPLPHGEQSALDNSAMVIRRRIANSHMTQEDASTRFLELFYPATNYHSQVLLLSPQAQLSPMYFHYARYALLDYQYSTYGAHDSRNVMGASLDLPATLLDGKSKLTPPTLSDMYTSRYHQLYSGTASSPFLWQAPNSQATLFFGNKWAEFHSFLSNRIVKHHTTERSPSRAKLVSEKYPAWTEYMLEFMRARGYSLLYPVKMKESFATIHNELYHAPEEFTRSAPAHADKSSTPADISNEPFLRDVTPSRAPNNPESRLIPSSKPLHLGLPFDGDLPEILHIPQLLYDGTIVPHANVTEIAEQYADAFRASVGGCAIPKGKHRKILPGDTRDLFCFGDEDVSDWEDDGVDGEFQEPVLADAEGLMVDDNPPKTAFDQTELSMPMPTLKTAKALETLTIVADEF